MRASVVTVVAACLAVSCAASRGSIGAMLSKSHTDGRVLVREVPKDMEASKAGLQPGDQVLTIDGRDARRMTAEEIHEALVGPVGSTVDITVSRGDEVVRLQVRRGVLK